MPKIQKIKKSLLRASLLCLVIASSLTGVSCQSAQATPSTYNDWSWFKDTYWVVPAAGIYAIAHNPNDPRSFNVIRDQTVFHLTDYFNGYFVGVVIAKLSQEQTPSCQYVLGEVTPQGAVSLTMYDTTSGAIINQPIGNMVRVNDAWTMVNMMTAPATNGGSVSHWAYMVLSKPGDQSWDNLPFANESIPSFVSKCPDGPTFGF